MVWWRRGRQRANSFRETWMALGNIRRRNRPGKNSGKRPGKLLGILVDESGLLVAECQADPGTVSGSVTLSHTARFPMASGNGLENLAAAAPAFIDFLKQQKFTSRRVLFGLPARHLMLLRHELPKADEQTTASALWLHASSVFPPELGKTAFDFVSDNPDSASRAADSRDSDSRDSRDPQLQQVTIVGLQQPLSDRLREFCAAAGLHADCAMPTSFALTHATGRMNGNALILHRRETTAELLVQVDHLPRLLRSVPPVTLPSELRRAAAQLPVGAAKAFVVWDCAAADPVQDDLLSAAAGMPLTRPDVGAMGLAKYGAAPDRNLLLAALFDAATASDRSGLNLFEPRIVEPRPAIAYRGRSLAMAVATAALAVLAVGWFDLQHLSSEAQRTRAQLDAMQPEIRNAKPLIQRLEYLSAFSAAQPRYLACLRDLTEAVEAIASVRLDHFDLNQAMQGNCAGQAAVEKDALEFVDRLNSSKRFAKVNCKLDTETSASEGEKVTFRIAFGYLPAER